MLQKAEDKGKEGSQQAGPWQLHLERRDPRLISAKPGPQRLTVPYCHSRVLVRRGDPTLLFKVRIKIHV